MHVVEIFEGVNQLKDFARGHSVDVDRQRRHELGFRRVIIKTRFLQSNTGCDEVRGVGDDLESTALVDHFFSSRVEHREQNIVLRDTVGLGDRNHALTGEIVGDRTGVSHRSTVSGHRRSNLGCRSVLIVREAFNEQGNAGRSVTLVHDRHIVDGLARQPGTALDRTIDVVVRHTRLFGLVHGVSERGVTSEVCATHFGGNFDVLDEFGKGLRTFAVNDSLFVLCCRPFGVSGHNCSLTIVRDDVTAVRPRPRRPTTTRGHAIRPRVRGGMRFRHSFLSARRRSRRSAVSQ
ncbi:unannotated protein [freshwater metagenome]|uniref:Unannotated protein n=1 Tax=freshwater metagenome TaxID=449393 RepID=A0A6J6J5L5_9ZZZZ